MGSQIYRGWQPRADAPVVMMLKRAGATIIGKTTTTAFASRDPTPTLNPHNPGHSPGGSSSGSAAAVAAGLVDLGLATDTGGSIRVPSSQCGIFGWRPTHGAVPTEGLVPLAPSFDTVGLLARDVRLLRAGATVMLGCARGTAPAGGHLVGVGEAWAGAPDDVRAGLRALVGSDASDLGIDLRRAAEAFSTCQAWEAWQEHGHWFETAHPDLAPDIAGRFRAAARVTATDVERAREVVREVAARVRAATAGGNVLVHPAAPGAAPPLELSEPEAAAWRTYALQLTCLAGLAGAPVVVVPLLHDEGLPVGAALVGAPDTDLSLLARAATLADPTA
jgi:amidase